MRTLAVALVVLTGAGCERTPRLEPPPPEERIGEIQSLLLPDVASPSETLAVRVVGTLGPDGSWASGGTSVQRGTSEVLIAPRVRRVPGDFFTQALVPYDTIIHVNLPPGDWTVRAAARDTILERAVSIRDGARRDAPRVQANALAPSTSGEEQFVPVEVTATVESGFIGRIEWRDAGGAWMPVQVVEAPAATATVRFAVQRPAGDAARRIEVRAVDGQGAVSPVAVIELPAR
jgi:hypothetical protein